MNSEGNLNYSDPSYNFYHDELNNVNSLDNPKPLLALYDNAS